MVNYYCFPLLPEQFDPCPSDTTNGGTRNDGDPNVKIIQLGKVCEALI